LSDDVGIAAKKLRKINLSFSDPKGTVWII
jgi:hypothetical protein